MKHNNNSKGISRKNQNQTQKWKTQLELPNLRYITNQIKVNTYININK